MVEIITHMQHLVDYYDDVNVVFLGVCLLLFIFTRPMKSLPRRIL